MTQTERLIAYLRENPGATSLEVTLATNLVNVTGRVSDARVIGREHGFDIECRRRDRDNRFGYFLVEKDRQLTLDVA